MLGLASRTRRRAAPVLAAGVFAGLAAWAAPTPARACGGTFCDNLATPMPVDQTGENILFVVDGPDVIAHIQINIDPAADADKFAWVIPVASMPDFSIGSQPLFDALLDATVPRYSIVQGGACAPGSDGDDSTFLTSPDGGAGSGPQAIQEVVGALDVTTLTGGTAAEVLQWLVTNDFAEDDRALPLLQQYVDDGWMFVAVRLASHATVEEVHPLVMRYSNAQPCVPLRLTSIAAKEDMEVRTFFLGDSRVAPSNYKHVRVNPLKLDWLNRASNYKEVVTMAVDQEGADGKAFVTEFAGASAAVSQTDILGEEWDATPFVAIDPVDAIEMLTAQGLFWCGDLSCSVGHPLVLGIVRKYLPAPEGVEEQQYWSSFYDPRRAPMVFPAWDGPAFATELQTLIIDPGYAAVELLDTWPYLTRMYTTISPGEMSEDPLFHPHPDLPPVPANRQAIQDFECGLDGDSIVRLPDGREVYLPDGESWPEFSDEMPWEEDVEEVGDVGAPMAIVDNTALIDALLAEYNAAVSGGMMGDSGGDAPGEGGNGTGGAMTGGPAFPADTGSDGDGGDAGANDLTRSGCACQVDRGVGGTFGFGIGLLLAGLLTRRRRPSARRAR